MSEFSIRAEGLFKQYKLGANQGRYQYKRLTEELGNLIRAPLTRLHGDIRPTIWALQDVSFEVKQGEVLGIIGRNGAGKSTLLKILSRVTEPTAGRAVLHGRVGSLLEVGVGFHPELTGRENIYLSGTIMGMSKGEIDRKFDEIVEFAGVEQFVDTPIKRFSSGMYVRLAFAVAAHLESEILLVDEVLAVGDAAFQKKSLGKMGEVAGQGRTVLLVSHNMGSIRQLCRRCIWIDQGSIKGDGQTEAVVDDYLMWGQGDGAQAMSTYEEDTSKVAQIRQVRLLNREGLVVPNFIVDEPIVLEITYQLHRVVSGLYGYVQVSRSDGTVALISYSFDTVPNPLDTALPVGKHVMHVMIPPRTLGHGSYTIQSGLGRGLTSTEIVDEGHTVCSFNLDDNASYMGNRRRGYFSTLLDWSITKSINV